MRRLLELFRRGRALAAARREDRESREEFAFHIEMETEKNLSSGMAPEEARRRALAAFGSRAAALEYTRDARGWRFLEDALRDLSLALRKLRRQAGFSLTTLLTIALGLGAATAIWSVVDGVLLRPAPLDLDRLAMIWETDRASGTRREPASWPDFEDFQRQNRSFSATAALSGREPSLLPEEGESVRLVGIATSAEYFALLGVRPLLGRTYDQSEARPGGAAVAVLGEGLWRSRFGADPGVLGRVVVLDDRPFEVVGVVPRSAGFGLDQIHARAAYHSAYTGGTAVDVWLPLQVSAETNPRSNHPFLVVGRLRDGVDLATAHTEAEAIAAALEEAYPDSNANRGMFVESFDQVILAPVRPTLWILMAGVGLLLAVAFVNVTNLLLARGATHGSEVAVRSALGAGLGRLARQMLIENALLTAIGAVLGIGVAMGLLRLLIQLAPRDIPRIAEVGIDGRVLLLTFSISIVGALCFSLVPTLQARRVDVLGTIQGSGRYTGDGPGSRRWRLGLVVAEIAFSVVLVVFAGLLVRSLWNVLEVDPGFHAEGVLKAQYRLPASRYPVEFSRWPHLDEIQDFNRRLLERASALPGVRSAAIAGSHPLDPGFTNSFQVVGREADGRSLPEISVRAVSPEYFSTLGLALSEGRFLEASDGPDGAAVAVINRAAAELVFEGRPALGQAIRFWGTERRIVGVVEDERIRGLAEAVPIALYAPIAQMPISAVLLVRAASGDPMALADEVSGAIRAEDPGLAVFGVERLEETLAGTFAERRFAMLVVLMMAAATLLLSLIGVHGVLSYAVAQRRRELGIRAALGARRIDVTALVLKSGLMIAATGVALGLAIAMAGSRYLSKLLFEVPQVDPPTYALVAAGALAVSLLASWFPARRAARAEVLEALRAE